MSPSSQRKGERRREVPSLPAPRTRAIAVCLLAFAASGCGDAGLEPGAVVETSTDPIVGGVAAAHGEFPAVVSLGGCSGTLVHPSLVVYAAHCGTAISVVRFGSSADAPERLANVERCRGFPGARLGDGSDLAYCVLAEPVLDIEPERVMAGCELQDLAVARVVTIAGFGVDRDGGAYGEKRYATSRIQRIGDELILESGGADTCRGDSGGPVFVNRVEPDGRIQRRLIGVTSAGTQSECGQGIGHYVNVTAKLDWLEEATQLDLSPCFDQGEWLPSPACVATGSPRSGGGYGPEQRDQRRPAFAPLASCGDAFHSTPDELPPSVAWDSPSAGARYALAAGDTFVEVELAVEATDVGGGVQRVSFTLLDELERVLFERADEVAPYGLPTFRLPPGRFTLEAEALDFAGNAASSRVAVRVDVGARAASNAGGGCVVSPGNARRSHISLLALALLSATARRVSKWRHSRGSRPRG